MHKIYNNIVLEKELINYQEALTPHGFKSMAAIIEILSKNCKKSKKYRKISLTPATYLIAKLCINHLHKSIIPHGAQRWNLQGFILIITSVDPVTKIPSGRAQRQFYTIN